MKNGWKISDESKSIAGLLPAGSAVYRKNNLVVIFSPLETYPDGNWSHASISHHARYPTWDEILDVRYSFFGDNDEVFQILPPKIDYTNIRPNCFHLWSPIGRHMMPNF